MPFHLEFTLNGACSCFEWHGKDVFQSKESRDQIKKYVVVRKNFILESVITEKQIECI